jgi:uncharacterized protein YijF (DUF1287 family)
MNLAQLSKLLILPSAVVTIAPRAYNPSSPIASMSYSPYHALSASTPLKLAALILCLACRAHPQTSASSRVVGEEFLRRLVAAAIERTHHTVRYDPAYVRIPYPGGDVSADTGVCTDEVIRSYRRVGVDLQKEVHEDMVANYSAYPHKWNWLLRRPDANIDHRRVPNLMVFFARHGELLPASTNATDYQPGDLVTWDLGGNVPHIGVVVDQKGDGGRYMIVHNIGQGPRMEDILFHWKITGHYR